QCHQLLPPSRNSARCASEILEDGRFNAPPAFLTRSVSKIAHTISTDFWETFRRRHPMAKLTSTPDTTEFSDAKIKQMLAWLASVARDESESRAKRKNVCVASLSMAELFE